MAIFDTQYLGGAGIFDSQALGDSAEQATTYATPRKKYHAQPSLSLLSDAPAGAAPRLEPVPAPVIAQPAPLDLSPQLARIAQFEQEAQAALIAQAAANQEYRALIDAIAAQAAQEAQQQAIQAAQAQYDALMVRMDEEDIEMLLLAL